MTVHPCTEATLRKRASEPLVVQVDPTLDPEALQVGPHAVPWTTEDGMVHAICDVVDGYPTIVFPRIGTVRVQNEQGQVLGMVADVAAIPILHEVYYRFALPMLMQAAGAEMLHASGVVGHLGAVAFCGISGTGKSTLAFSLSRRGNTPWADDSLVFWPKGEGFETVRLPFRPRIELPEVGYQERIEGELVLPLGAIVVLRRLAGGVVGLSEFHVEVRKLAPAEAFRAILPHIYSFALSDAARNALMMSRYFDVAARVPVFDVGFTPCIEALPNLCEVIERRILSAA